MKDKLKILVVEDNGLDQTAVCQVLTKAAIDLDLENVNSVNHTLIALKNGNFDYIFLDYNLSVKDSLTIIEKIRCLEIKIPIIILTVPECEQTAVKLVEAGATEYFFQSQISPEHLPLILRNVMRLYQAEMKAKTAYQQLTQSNKKLIQQQHQLEQKSQEIHLLKLKLIEASRLKSEFLSIISHELRTPMNAIMGFSQMLLRPKLGQLTNQQTDMVKRIFNNGQNLMTLLNDLLDFSQLESGTFELTVKKCDLAEIVDSSVEKIRTAAEVKNLALVINKDIENSLIWNDATRVDQILNNLLTNAVKFTESGSICLDVKEISSDRLSITIRDTGIGIAAQDCQSIFEAFRQIDQGLNRQYSGKGLGLAIIDSLIKMMGGQIFLESELGVGSVFTVELPREINVLDYIQYEDTLLVRKKSFNNTQNMVVNQKSAVSSQRSNYDLPCKIMD